MLGVDQKAHCFADGRTPTRGPFLLLRGLRLCRRRRRLGLSALHRLLLGRRRNRFGLHHGQYWLGRISVEIGNRARGFRSWRRGEFVRDRSGEAVLGAAAPAASATTSATAGTPLSALRLIGANLARLFVGFVLVGFALIRNDAGNSGCFKRHAR